MNEHTNGGPEARRLIERVSSHFAILTEGSQSSVVLANAR